MPNHLEDALNGLNPCGIENKPDSQCKYKHYCRALGEKTRGFLCLQEMAYQVARYLLTGNDIEREREDLAVILSSAKKVPRVDPRCDYWMPEELQDKNIKEIVDEIIAIGKKMHESACNLGNLRNPVNFECALEEAIRDLHD